MKYILITHDKLKFILEEKDYAAFVSAISNNDKAFVMKKYKSVIPLHITPTVIPFEVWYSQENERLALTHHRLCKKCLGIMHIQDKCPCWDDQGKREVKSAFIAPKLPGSVKAAVDKIADSKGFPELDNWDKGMLEEEKKKEQRKIAGPDPEGGYRDPETGEIFFQ